MLTPTGRVYAEVTVSALAKDHYYVITGGGSEFHDLRLVLYSLIINKLGALLKCDSFWLQVRKKVCLFSSNIMNTF